MKYVTRVHLKTGTEDRERLINFCLKNEKQYIAIGWSSVYKKTSIKSYEDYFLAVQEVERENSISRGKKFRTNTVLNIFRDIKPGDLIWTRDLDGFYWTCKATSYAKIFCDIDLDIGAVVQVEAYKYGLEVPGQIKAAFNRRNGGTAQRIGEKIIIEFSKHQFNQLSNRSEYNINMYGNLNSKFINNLPDCELEELVISYIQIKFNYYLLSNSIANKSTTINIECVLHSREINSNRKAVVQVKARHKGLVEHEYENYINDDYIVYIYDGGEELNNSSGEAPNNKENFRVITRGDLFEFYCKYKSILPESITMWENILS